VHANTLFPEMFTWLEDVKHFIQKNPDTLFVIRAHPDEYRPNKESRESVRDWVKARLVSIAWRMLFSSIHVNSSVRMI
jgi:hypothetical protein